MSIFLIILGASLLCAFIVLAALLMPREYDRNRIVNYLCCGTFTLDELEKAFPDMAGPKMRELLAMLCATGRVKQWDSYSGETLYGLI